MYYDEHTDVSIIPWISNSMTGLAESWRFSVSNGLVIVGTPERMRGEWVH
jgi:hypothetical protein